MIANRTFQEGSYRLPRKAEIRGVRAFVLIGLAVWGGLATAQAAAITITPASSTVGTGGTVQINVGITGLGNGTSPSLGAFDFTLNFPNFLNFSLLTFGDSVLGKDELDLEGFGTIHTITPGTGKVEAVEISLDDPAVLDALQAPSFTLARLSFNAVAPGSGSFTLTNVTLSDEIGNTITPTNIGTATVTVTGSAVPEPATFLPVLTGFGLGFLLFRRRKRRA